MSIQLKGRFYMMTVRSAMLHGSELECSSGAQKSGVKGKEEKEITTQFKKNYKWEKLERISWLIWIGHVMSRDEQSCYENK